MSSWSFYLSNHRKISAMGVGQRNLSSEHQLITWGGEGGGTALQCTRVSGCFCFVWADPSPFCSDCSESWHRANFQKTRHISESPSVWSQVLMQTLWLYRRQWGGGGGGGGETSPGWRAAKTNDITSPACMWSHFKLTGTWVFLLHTVTAGTKVLLI